MDGTRVLEWTRDPRGIWDFPRAQVEALAREFPGVRFDAPATREEAEASLPEADVVLGYVLRPENFASARRLRWVHSMAAGVTGMLFPAFVESEVVLTNGRGVHAPAMAEHALGVMLAFTRRLHLARDAQRERAWRQRELGGTPPSFGELAGRTLGLVGFGEVGSAVARAARAFGMEVIAVRRRPAADPAPAHAQWPPERLGEMLALADWVVLVAPQTAATTGMIGAAELARMKPGARLVNLGRGALVDEPALIEALRSGRLAGAALDVFATEPLPAASPLWEMPEVIVTPHTSGTTPEYWDRCRERFAANLRRWLAGEPLEYVVDKRAGY